MHPLLPSSAAPADPRAEPPPPAGRRRIWQLPADLRAALVGLGLSPERLRRCAERALERLHRRPVELLGSDADVLSSVLCDLGTRNAISDAVQAELTARHAGATGRLAGVRDAAALQQAWRAALAAGDVPGTAWALLTHPLGAPLDDALRVDLRGWTCAQVHAAQARQAADAGLHERLLHARAEADTLRLRLQQEQAAFERERAALAGELAAWRGRCQALRAASRAQSAESPARRGEADQAPPPPRPEPAGRPSPPPPAPVPGEAVDARHGRAVLPADAAPPAGHPTPGPTAAAAPVALRGRRVLCVGGMPGAQERYRALVETAGARFDFHDGGLEQGLHRLDRQLGAADLVVCQAGCVNHEAYRRVKGHCRRADKPCLFVPRPSLAHFARTLGLAAQERA